MRRFYTQQICATCLIAGAWIFVVFLLTRGDASVTQTLQQPEVAARALTRLEPRQEETGEECRIHKFDELGTRTQVEIKFKDKASAVVFFNQFGKRARAIEYATDGSRQEYTFAFNGRSLRRHRSYRPDGTLKSETLPVGKNEARVTRFAEDGKRKVSEQTVRAGGVETKVFHQDGKTVRHVHHETHPMRTELHTHDERGVLTDKDVITKQMAGGFMMPPFLVLTVEHVRLRPDGTVSFKQKFQVVNKRHSLFFLEEYAADGKTVLFRLSRVANNTPGIHVAGREPALKLEIFDAKGELQQVKLLRADLSVIRVEDVKAKTGRDVSNPNEKESRFVELSLGSPAADLDKLQHIQPKVDPNHYGQLITD